MRTLHKKIAIISRKDVSKKDSKLIIDTLKSLGGRNTYRLLADSSGIFYFINDIGHIYGECIKPKGYSTMTLDELKEIVNEIVLTEKTPVVESSLEIPNTKVAIKSDGIIEHGTLIINHLISLGGINELELLGTDTNYYYYINDANNYINRSYKFPKGYKEIFIEAVKNKEVITPIEHQSDVVPVEDQKGTIVPVKSPFVEGWYYVKQHSRDWEMRYVIAMGVNDRPIVIGNHTASIHKSIIDYFNGQSVECLVFNYIKPIDSKLFNLYNQHIKLQLEIDKLERELKIK